MSLIKSILVILLLMGPLIGVQGQESSQDSVKPKQTRNRKINILLGFKAGPSNYTLTGSEVDFRTARSSTLENRVGIEFGLVATVEFFRWFYLRTEADHVEKGGHLKGGGFVYQDPVETTYLTVPAIIGLIPFRSKHVVFAVEGGIATNWLQDFNDPYRQGLSYSSYSTAQDVVQSMILGAEMSYLIDSDLRIVLNYRYSRDLEYFYVRGFTTSSKTYDLWNEGSSLTLGISYKLL